MGSMRAFEAIKWSVYWDSKGREKGGRKWKSEFVEKSCERYWAPQIARANASTHHKKDLAALMRKWKRQHEKVVTERNQLRQLYLVVTCSTSYLY